MALFSLCRLLYLQTRDRLSRRCLMLAYSITRYSIRNQFPSSSSTTGRGDANLCAFTQRERGGTLRREQEQ